MLGCRLSLRLVFDPFTHLQVSRRPWLDEATVKESFHRLAAIHHPDQKQGDTQAFSDLTKAYEILRHPASRLRHLIELENLGGTEGRPLPVGLEELFTSIATIRQQVNSALARRGGATNALSRSLAATEVQRASEAAEQARQRIESELQVAESLLKQVDEKWPSAEAREALPDLQARFTFLTKWLEQLREAILQIQIS